MCMNIIYVSFRWSVLTVVYVKKRVILMVKMACVVLQIQELFRGTEKAMSLAQVCFCFYPCMSYWEMRNGWFILVSNAKLLYCFGLFIIITMEVLIFGNRSYSFFFEDKGMCGAPFESFCILKSIKSEDNFYVCLFENASAKSIFQKCMRKARCFQKFRSLFLHFSLWDLLK